MRNTTLAVFLTILLVVVGALIALFWNDITGKVDKIIEDNKEQETTTPEETTPETETASAMALIADMPIYC